MKRLHRDDLFGWSIFDESRDIDFHGVAWVRDGGNVLVDPVPMSAHDEAHLRDLGGAATIVVTNSDHVRAAAALAETFGARILGPCGEQDRFPIRCDGWLGDGEAVVPGLIAHTVSGSKTPGELALVLDGATLIAGDLIRAHEGWAALPAARRETGRSRRGTIIGAAPRGPAGHRRGARRRRLARVPPRRGRATRAGRLVRRPLTDARTPHPRVAGRRGPGRAVCTEYGGVPLAHPHAGMLRHGLGGPSGTGCRQPSGRAGCGPGPTPDLQAERRSLMDPPVWRAYGVAQSVSPDSSSAPIMTLRFCTAAPDAPLPRLSRRATSRMRESSP